MFRVIMMFLVNFVLYDEEIYEPYEWQIDDRYEEFSYLVIFHFQTSMLYDFLYGTLKIDDMDDGIYIIGDSHYCFVVEISNHMILRRGTIDYQQQNIVFKIIDTLPVSSFHYTVLQRACVKEFGLTRLERTKKQVIEEMLEDAYYYHNDVLKKICKEFMITDNNKTIQYQRILSMIETGYNHVHDILYEQFISKKFG